MTLSLGLAGCGLIRDTERAPVRDIQIRERITPPALLAKTGDEIRWHNQLSHPVQLSILEAKGLEHVACDRGFRRFGQIEDLVTIQPHSYASLCFSKAATIRYNVWLNPDDRVGSMTPTAVIRVE